MPEVARELVVAVVLFLVLTFLGGMAVGAMVF